MIRRRHPGDTLMILIINIKVLVLEPVMIDNRIIWISAKPIYGDHIMH